MDFDCAVQIASSMERAAKNLQDIQKEPRRRRHENITSLYVSCWHLL